MRESENMVRDTTTRLVRATGELEDLIVRACYTARSPPFLIILLMRVIIRHLLKGMRNWSRIRNYAMLRLSLWQSVVLDDDDDKWPRTQRVGYSVTIRQHVD